MISTANSADALTLTADESNNRRTPHARINTYIILLYYSRHHFLLDGTDSVDGTTGIFQMKTEPSAPTETIDR